MIWENIEERKTLILAKRDIGFNLELTIVIKPDDLRESNSN